MNSSPVADMKNLLFSAMNPVEYEVAQYVIFNEEGEPQLLHQAPDLDQYEVAFLGLISEGLNRPESVSVSYSDPRLYVSDVQTIYIDGVDDLQSQENVDYVNPKQYYRILKRRQERERLVKQGRIPKSSSKYLYESRHNHALNRLRNSAGKFVKQDSRKRVKDEKEEEEIQLVAEHQGGVAVKTEMEENCFDPDVILPSFNRGGLKQKKDSYKEE